MYLNENTQNLWEKEDKRLINLCELQHQQQKQKKNDDFISIHKLKLNNLLINYVKLQNKKHINLMNFVNQDFFQYLNYKLQINVLSSQNLPNSSYSYFNSEQYFSNINDLFTHFRFFIQHFLVINKGNSNLQIYVPFYSVLFVSDKIYKLKDNMSINNKKLELFYTQQNNPCVDKLFTSQAVWISNYNSKFLEQDYTNYINLSNFSNFLEDKPNLFNIYQKIISDITDIYKKQIVIQFPFQFIYVVCKKITLRNCIYPSVSSFQAVQLQAEYIHQQSIIVFKLSITKNFDQSVIFQNKKYIFFIELYNNLNSGQNLQSILECIESYIVKLNTSTLVQHPLPNYVQFYIKDIITQHDFFRFLLYYIFTINYSTLYIKEQETLQNSHMHSDIKDLKNKILKDSELIKNSSLQSLQSFMSDSQY